MNFIESIFDSFQKGMKQISGEYPNEIKTYCIGSGSNFIIHKNISIKMAEELYEKYKNKMPLGKKISEKQIGSFILESFQTLESNTGITYCFMFEITQVIEHNANDVIQEWIETDKKNKGFMKELIKNLTEKKTKK